MRSWMRETRVIIGNMQFESPDFTIECDVNFGDDDDANDAEIKIYNLSRSTLNRIKKHEPVIINAGYEGDTGNIFLGAVLNSKTDKDGVDRITTIVATDASEAWNEMEISESFKAGTRASQVLDKILGMTGLEIGAIDLPNDVEYQRTRTFKGKLRDVIKRIARDTGAKVFILNGKIFLRDPDEGGTVQFRLDSERGLVGTPERFEEEGYEGYRVTALLNHRMTTDSKIRIESETANGVYRIKKGKHVINDSDFYTITECVE